MITKDQVREQLVLKLDRWKEELLHRFDEGRKKHEDQPLEGINFEQEMKEEIMDYFLYGKIEEILNENK